MEHGEDPRAEASPPSLPSAQPAVLEAARRGDAHAQYLMALSLLVDDPRLRDAGQAAIWLCMAADLGYAPALLRLGLMHLLGEDMPRDAEAALRLYTAAAEQGDVEAAVRLGLMYAFANGIPRDLLTAYAWFNVAAAAGHRPARQTRRSIRAALSPDDLAEANARSERLAEKIRQRAERVVPGVPAQTPPAATELLAAAGQNAPCRGTEVKV